MTVLNLNGRWATSLLMHPNATYEALPVRMLLRLFSRASMLFFILASASFWTAGMSACITSPPAPLKEGKRIAFTHTLPTSRCEMQLTWAGQHMMKSQTGEQHHAPKDS